MSGDLGAWSKLKSSTRLPSGGAASLTPGRGSGRPSVRGIEASPTQEIVFDELQISVKESVWWSTNPCRAYGLMTSPGTRIPYPYPSIDGGQT